MSGKQIETKAIPWTNTAQSTTALKRAISGHLFALNTNMKIKHRPCSSSENLAWNSQSTHCQDVFITYASQETGTAFCFKFIINKNLQQLTSLILLPCCKQRKGRWKSYFMIPQAPFGLQSACCTSLLFSSPKQKKQLEGCAAFQAPALLPQLHCPQPCCQLCISPMPPLLLHCMGHHFVVCLMPWQ